VDGFIEGPTGEVDWIGTWEDSFDLLPQIDTCILGGGMYPGYEQYWRTILANPDGILSLTGKVATEGEVAYARYADRTPHIVLSTTLDTVAWKTARIVRDVEDIRELKQQPGKDMYAVGGATLVSSLLNLDLIDEVRLTVHPVVLGGGKALFKDVKERHALELVRIKPLTAGRTGLIYRT
jgi:dihydrofolate reductase